MSSIRAHAEMLIRRPPRVVFDAFVEPETLRRFWLEHSSAPLAPGATVQWRFLVPGAGETVRVTGFERGAHLSFDWSAGLHVELRFDAFDRVSTRVRVEVDGFVGDDAVRQAVDTTEGFSIVLCELKLLLERGSAADLVRDKAALIVASMRE